MPNLHVLVAGLIQGNFDEISNWNDIVQPAFDSIKVDGIESNMLFYNALLEVLWWSGQRSRAARVLGEGKKRGMFPESFSRTSSLWSVDVHRWVAKSFLCNVIEFVKSNWVFTVIHENVFFLAECPWGLR